MVGETVSIDAHDGRRFSAYLTKPSGGVGPAVMILNEGFGLTRWTKSIADRFAARGYLACAPELYWRTHPGLVAEPNDQENVQIAIEQMTNIDRDLAIEDIAAAIASIRGMPESSDKLAVAGFGLGGTLAYLAAARLEIDATAAYYGSDIHQFVNEGRHLDHPIVFHLADRDETNSESDRKRIFAALIGIPHVSIYSYDAGHAFTNSDRKNCYDADAAEQAHARTFAVLDTLI